MNIQEFADKYKMTSETIYMFKKKGRLPRYVFTKVKGKRAVQIDEQYFIKRKAFQNYIIKFNQTMYYYQSMTHSDRAISRKFTNQNSNYKFTCFATWLGRDLPKVKLSMMLVEVTQTHWDFFKYNRRLLKRLGLTIEQVKDSL